ncbi:MAG: glycerate kinase [Actinobacteria bacterium]|nr:glycerate kinase [Actinomycetota bacterium]MCL5070266.1 glycerate kinase [Actinomycetota bacterium]
MKTKIIVACDKYKGNLSAIQVCSIIKDAINETAHYLGEKVDIIINPMADGGEGTVDTLVDSLDGKLVNLKVTGPLGNKVNSKFGVIGQKTAVIEMSAASGLWMVPKDRRNPLETTTYGTGELIEKALEIGCSKIIVGIGGSATNDAGMGMAQALGVRFYDSNKNLLGFGGKELIKINKIDVSEMNPMINSAKFEIASDVDNPLFGPNGAAYVYGPQKGADNEMVKLLDEGLRNFSHAVKRSIGKDITNIKGAGAAGGMGAGLVAFLNATIRSGVEIILEATDLERKMDGADLVITGEGAMDSQTFSGKSSYGIAMLAKKLSIPVITINGSKNFNTSDINKKKLRLFSGNFAAVNKPMNLEEAIKNGKSLLAEMTRELICFFLATRFKASGSQEII